MTDKLSIYNGALRLLKERRLSSLTENREPRRLLDDAWDDGQTSGVVKYCLEMGQWTFATRTVQIDYSPSVEPDFGYRYAFDQPSDMVKPVGIYSDGYCQLPLLDYVDERHYWFCDVPTFYARYVSNDTSYGADISLWPETFVNMVQARLATEIAMNLTSSENLMVMADRAWKVAKKEALSSDAMRKPTAFAPPGRWGQARRRGVANRSGWDQLG